MRATEHKVTAGATEHSKLGYLLAQPMCGDFCVLAFHMDDSADKQRQKVVVVAGLLGHYPDWFDPERYWKMRLEKDGIEYFRTNNYRMLNGPFDVLVNKHGPEKAKTIADKLFEDLKLIIKSSDLVVAALGVLMKDYKKVLATVKGRRVLQADPYIAAHQQVVGQIASISTETEDQPYIAFLYDQSSHAKRMGASWDKFKERNPISAKCMGTLAPLDDKLYPCIQMADMIANATKSMFEKMIDSGKPLKRIKDKVELKDMEEWAKKIGWIGFWDEKYLRLLVRENLKYALPLEQRYNRIEGPNRIRREVGLPPV